MGEGCAEWKGAGHFPRMVGQIPVYYAHNNTGRPATRNEVLLNDIAVEAGQTSLGCTSFYMDAGFDPLFRLVMACRTPHLSIATSNWRLMY